MCPRKYQWITVLSVACLLRGSFGVRPDLSSDEQSYNYSRPLPRSAFDSEEGGDLSYDRGRGEFSTRKGDYRRRDDVLSSRVGELSSRERLGGGSNGVNGEPRVLCNPTGVTFEMETITPFAGAIYARNEYYKPTCRASFAETREQLANSPIKNGGSFKLNFNECGMIRERMVAPTRGMAYSITLIVQFHSTFVTAADKAFQVRCFYRERTVDVNANTMDVSPLATEIMHIDHPMPKCVYTLKHNGIDGPAATFARVGDPVVHTFECDNDIGTYAMLVRDCTVSDGKENIKKLIDHNGCAIDEDLMRMPQYASQRLDAYAHATVFKWPDESAVHFACQLTLCMLEDEQCRYLTPPRCGTDNPRRTRRETGITTNVEITGVVMANGTTIEMLSPEPPSVDVTERSDSLMKVELQSRRLIVLDKDEKIDEYMYGEMLQQSPPRRGASPMAVTVVSNSSMMGEVRSSTPDTHTLAMPPPYEYERHAIEEAARRSTVGMATTTTATTTTSSSTTRAVSTTETVTRGATGMSAAQQLVFLHERRIDQLTRQLGRTCYGNEYVVAFALMTAFFLAVLTGFTVRLLYPTARRLYRLYVLRMSQSTRPSSVVTLDTSAIPPVMQAYQNAYCQQTNGMYDGGVYGR